MFFIYFLIKKNNIYLNFKKKILCQITFNRNSMEKQKKIKTTKIKT